jgi:hypothetical protein
MNGLTQTSLSSDTDLDFGAFTLPVCPPKQLPQDLFANLGEEEPAIVSDPEIINLPTSHQAFHELVDDEQYARSENPFPWPAKFCVDLVLGFISEEAVLAKYGVDEETYERFKRLPAFRRDLAMAMGTIREEGLTFKTKCRLFSEEYLTEIYQQMFDKSVGVSQRFTMFQQLVKLGGLEPEKEKTVVDQFANFPRVNIQINL